MFTLSDAVLNRVFEVNRFTGAERGIDPWPVISHGEAS